MTKEKIEYNPMNDVLFKFIFGKEERKQITINFLNAVLEREGDKRIKDIQFQNVELVPAKEEDKLSRIDVFAILDNNERVDIEVQMINHHNMEKRTLFYWSHMFLHHNALKRGDSYQQLKPAISINLLRYNFLPQKNAHTMYGLYERETHHRLTDVIEIHFLEVLKYKKKPIEQMNIMEKWIAFFSNKLNKTEKEELAMSEPAIQGAMEAAENFFQDSKSYWDYINREAAILDYNSDMLAAREEGIKQGVEQGREQGEGKLSRLFAILLKEGKQMEMIEASSDPIRRQELYKKYGII